MFWGLEIQPKKSYTQTPPCGMKVSQAVLGPDAKPGRNVLVAKVGNQKFAVCSLNLGKTDQSHVDLVFGRNQTVTFTVYGESTVWLSGYYLPPDMEMGEGSDSDEEGATEFGFDELEHEETDDITDRNTISNAKLAKEVSDKEKALGDLFGKKKAAIEAAADDDSEEEDDDDYVPSGSEEGDHEIPDEEEEEGEYESEYESEEEKAAAPAPSNEKKRKREEDSNGPQTKKPKKPEITVTQPTPVKEAKKKEATATPAKEAKKEGGLKTPKAPLNKRKLKNGLEVIDHALGGGKKAVPGKRVTVNYVGKLANGKKFDSGRGFSFRLGQGEVIKGWDTGVSGMMMGGKRTLIIPPHLGYGSQRSGPIPPNSTLHFDVELVKC